MFKHILLPTDGSDLSMSAVRQGAKLAKLLGARVHAFHAIPAFHTFTYVTELLEATREEYNAQAVARAERYLASVRDIAKAEGVPCDSSHAVCDDPYEAIVEEAQKRGCDLIVMASHGRRGAKAVLLGSETLKVLTHSKVPVLVYR